MLKADSKKPKSIKLNFIMNTILTMSSFIFPLITFPYVSRVLGPSGTGKVQFALSFISYLRWWLILAYRHMASELVQA